MRSFLYPILALISAIVLTLPFYLTNPYRNLASLEASIASNPDQIVHRSLGGFLQMRDNVYILTLYLGNETGFDDSEFITIYRKGGQLEINLIQGPGESAVRVLKGKEAKRYLSQYRFDLSQLDRRVHEKTL